VRSWEFDPALYPGYAHRRTIGFKDGVSKKGNEEIVGRKGMARTWEFERV
jgi:25S rRNA (uracil2634-N3)-methyltransferase